MAIDDGVRLKRFIESTKDEVARIAGAIVAVADDETEAGTVNDLAAQLSAFLDRVALASPNDLAPLEIVNVISTALLLAGWEDVVSGRNIQRKGAEVAAIKGRERSNALDQALDAVFAWAGKSISSGRTFIENEARPIILKHLGLPRETPANEYPSAETIRQAIMKKMKQAKN